jgi:hypothetical protein
MSAMKSRCLMLIIGLVARQEMTTPLADDPLGAVALFEDVFVVVRWERANSVMTCNSKTAIIAGVAANRAFQPFTLLSSLAPRAGLVTWCQTFVHCSQQTAASNQSNELTPLHVEHRGLLPLCLLARRQACSVYRTLRLPQGGG